jgi:hypothetical protein
MLVQIKAPLDARCAMREVTPMLALFHNMAFGDAFRAVSTNTPLPQALQPVQIAPPAHNPMGTQLRAAIYVVVVHTHPMDVLVIRAIRDLFPRAALPHARHALRVITLSTPQQQAAISVLTDFSP